MAEAHHSSGGGVPPQRQENMNPDWLQRLQSFLGNIMPFQQGQAPGTGMSGQSSPNFMQDLVRKLFGSATWEGGPGVPPPTPKIV